MLFYPRGFFDVFVRFADADEALKSRIMSDLKEKQAPKYFGKFEDIASKVRLVSREQYNLDGYLCCESSLKLGQVFSRWESPRVE